MRKQLSVGMDSTENYKHKPKQDHELEEHGQRQAESKTRLQIKTANARDGTECNPVATTEVLETYRGRF